MWSSPRTAARDEFGPALDEGDVRGPSRRAVLGALRGGALLRARAFGAAPLEGAAGLAAFVVLSTVIVFVYMRARYVLDGRQLLEGSRACCKRA